MFDKLDAAGVGGGGMGRRQRNGDHCIEPCAGNTGRAVELNARRRSTTGLIGCVELQESTGNVGVDCFDRVQNARSTQARRVAVAKLQRFEMPLARAAGGHGAADLSAATGDFDLDRRLATAIEDLPGEDTVDASWRLRVSIVLYDS